MGTEGGSGGLTERAAVITVPVPPHTLVRLTELDALRGIAALIVLLHHAAQLVPWARLIPDSPRLASLLQAILYRTPLQVLADGRQAVLFFFVLSGYVIVLGLRRTGSPGLLAFAVGRTVRLLLPVAVSVLLSLVAYVLFFDRTVIEAYRTHTLYMWWNPVDVWFVVKNVFLVVPDQEVRINTVLWSLAHEWRLSILLPLVLAFRDRPVAVVAAGAVLCAGAVFVGTPQDRVMLDYSFLRSLAATAYFSLPVLIGAALALVAPLRWPSQPGDRWAVTLTLLALFSIESDIAYFAASALTIALASVPGGFRNFLRHPLLAWLGRMSFSLYLVHVIVLVSLLHAMVSSVPLLVIAMTGTVLSLLAAAVFHRIVERPSQVLARQAQQVVGRTHAV
ncbi:acyltransferase family protein [Roseomonas sp. CCTCC AB2023176]|uniref:acyltransferase family protein n=1 Tax=Roseomonas sp. CCTCC AB2023176 TaxID=3342640 RepID=UPI0035D97FC1